MAVRIGFVGGGSKRWILVVDPSGGYWWWIQAVDIGGVGHTEESRRVRVVHACPLLIKHLHVCVCACKRVPCYNKQESKTATDMPAVASFSSDTNAFVGTVR